MKVIFIDNLHHEHFTFFSEEDVIFFFKFLAKQKPHYIHKYASEVICIFELYLKKKSFSFILVSILLLYYEQDQRYEQFTVCTF